MEISGATTISELLDNNDDSKIELVNDVIIIKNDLIINSNFTIDKDTEFINNSGFHVTEHGVLNISSCTVECGINTVQGYLRINNSNLFSTGGVKFFRRSRLKVTNSLLHGVSKPKIACNITNSRLVNKISNNEDEVIHFR